jgi:hypothetical protein
MAPPIRLMFAGVEGSAASWACPSTPTQTRGNLMTVNFDAIDEAVLALFQLTRHDTCHAWKGFDWDVLDRLHERGLIDNPVGKTKSISMTDEGLKASRQAFEKLFGTLP